MELSFGEMMKLSWAMPALLVLSILVVAQALERAYAYWFSLRLPAALWERVRARLEEGDLPGALGLCRVSAGTMSQALERLLSLPEPSPEAVVEAFQLYRQKMSLDYARRVGFFGTASFISPLIGLFGTVMGIMRAFHDLAAAGAGGPAVVAAGISEALIATAFGIGVAIVSAVCYNYFTLTARERLGQADLWVFELSGLLSARAAPPRLP